MSFIKQKIAACGHSYRWGWIHRHSNGVPKQLQELPHAAIC